MTKVIKLEIIEHYSVHIKKTSNFVKKKRVLGFC